MAERVVHILPEGWPRPRGYSHGVISVGRALHIAGQFGKVPENAIVDPSIGFGAQWGLALTNVVRVVEAAGGSATDIVMLRAYLRNVEDFSKFGADVGRAWSGILGKHFPAMTIVQVDGLLDPGALLEIEGEAILG